MGMDIQVAIWVIGGFLGIALTINAFLLMAIFKDIGIVKIAMAEISVRGEGKEKRIENLEVNQKDLFERLNIVEREVLK